jgi:hypothetical protein
MTDPTIEVWPFDGFGPERFDFRLVAAVYGEVEMRKTAPRCRCGAIPGLSECGCEPKEAPR